MTWSGGAVAAAALAGFGPGTDPAQADPQDRAGVEAPLRDVEQATVAWVDRVRGAVVGVQPWRGGQPIRFNAGRSGSAVAIAHRDGVTEFLTSTGVIGGGVSRVKLTFPDGRTAEGTVVGRDSVSGAVLLQCKAATAQVLPLGRSAGAAVGTRVLTAGSPYGSLHRIYEVGMSVGTITGRYAADAAEPETGVADRYTGEVLETDAGVNPGSFGGPLCDRRGRVLGLVVQSLTRNRWLGCAAPIDPIRRRLPALRAGLGRSDTGVAAGHGGARLARAADGSGVVVLAAGDTPLQVGDVITAVRVGTAIKRLGDNAQAVADLLRLAGATVTGFTVVRDGESTDTPWKREAESGEDF
jgi:S1-C subfamily serine protease